MKPSKLYELANEEFIQSFKSYLNDIHWEIRCQNLLVVNQIYLEYGIDLSDEFTGIVNRSPINKDYEHLTVISEKVRKKVANDDARRPRNNADYNTPKNI